MKKAATILGALGVASAANAGLTLDDLSIGTLTAGSMVSGDTSTSTDDMGRDGIATGTSWSGGDDVYTVNWGGGDFEANLTFIDADGDIDLFFFDNNNPVANAAESIGVVDIETISIAGLAAGTYYLSVDGFFGATNTYDLSVVPAPSAMALLGLGGLVAGRRRR